jgi:hypothetical protein
MKLDDIPELTEKVANFGAMAMDSVTMLAGDDLWLTVAIYVFEAQELPHII